MDYLEKDGVHLMERERDVALYAKATYTCSEIQYKVEGRLIESLWVKGREESSKRDVIVGVCYRPSGREVNEAFFKRTDKLPNCRTWVSWGTSMIRTYTGKETALNKQPSKFLQCAGDNFDAMLDRPTRAEALLDLLLRNWEELVENVKMQSNFGNNDQKMDRVQDSKGEWKECRRL